MAATQLTNLSSLENTPRNVQVRVDFLKMGEIDTMNEKYSAEILIESKWSDFDPNLEEYDPLKHWNPKLYIQNVLTDPKEQTRYEYVREANCLNITEIKIIKAQFWERLELYNFPFDLQELNVILTTKLDSSQINLVADTDNFSLINQDAKRTFLDQQKWNLFSILKISDSLPKNQVSRSSSSDLDKKPSKIDMESNLKKKKKAPKLIVTAFTSRHPGFYLFNALFLIFLITASALTVFSISITLPANRLQVTYTILLSSISFKWVINRSLPPVSYLTLLDKYSIACIVYINVLAAYHSLIGSFYSHLPKEFDTWMLLAFLIIFFFIHLISIISYFVVSRKTRSLRQDEKRFISDSEDKNQKNKLLREEDEEDEYN